MHEPHRRLILALPLIATLGAGDADLQVYEYASAIRETARVRTLAQRLSKQNLLYQLRLGETRPEAVAETAAELDRVLETLEKGNPAYTVPPPPNAEIRQQLDRLDGAWAPLRGQALASRIDYLRRAGVSAEARRGDPLLVRHFDTLTQTVDREADELIELYAEACLAAGRGQRCRESTIAGRPAMLTERMTKELVFVVAGFDTRTNREGLRGSREAYEAVLERARSTSFVKRAIASSGSEPQSLIGQLWGNVDARWSELRGDVDLAIAEQADQIDLARALEAEEQLSEEMERLAGALRRRAAAARATRAQQP